MTNLKAMFLLRNKHPVIGIFHRIESSIFLAPVEETEISTIMSKMNKKTILILVPTKLSNNEFHRSTCLM